MPKKSEPPKPLAKALTLFNQLFGFLSSSINLKSYAVHSAIRFSNFISYRVKNYNGSSVKVAIFFVIKKKSGENFTFL